jgi:transposase
MEAIIERCCGLDVHQETVVACLLVGAPSERARKEVKTFGTMKADLERMAQWLKSAGCTHVVMESTGVYWMPVYLVLEGRFKLVVGNATHIKNVPGRKTDVKDSQWLAELLRTGMIKASFVPPRDLRELREVLRYRRKLVEAQTAERNRLLRQLELANIKLASVVSDVFGVSGRLMLNALIDGKQNPEQMAELARGRLRKKVQALAQALDGSVEEHHRFLLGLQRERLDQVAKDIAKVDARIDEKLKPYAEHMRRLTQIPGVDRVGAATIVAELGVDMSVFPTAQHAAAWAGVCPSNNESAGKRKAQTARKGNVHLKSALVQAAMGAARTKGTYFKEKYWRLAARRGKKRAALAIAHKILVAAFYVLKGSTDYTELGPGYLDARQQQATKKRLVKRLEALGLRVHVEPAVA